jgi:hypothetical protein
MTDDGFPQEWHCPRCNRVCAVFLPVPLRKGFGWCIHWQTCDDCGIAWPTEFIFFGDRPRPRPRAQLEALSHYRLVRSSTPVDLNDWDGPFIDDHHNRSEAERLIQRQERLAGKLASFGRDWRGVHDAEAHANAEGETPR